MSRIATTYTIPNQPEWNDATWPVDVTEGIGRAFRALARHRGAAILNGAVPAKKAYVDLLATAVLARRGEVVVLSDAIWEPGSRRLGGLFRQRRDEPGADVPPVVRGWLTRAVRAIVDAPTVHYVVPSHGELETFPRIWGVAPERVHFGCYCATTSEPDRLSEGGGGVFAGGNSLRDYRSLAAAAHSIDAPVTIGTSLTPKGPTPAKIGLLPQAEYDRQALAADVVVVPMLADTARSSGHQTYLNAMLRGQGTIVTEAPGVRDYIDDGRTGLVVPNEPRALAEAVNRLLRDDELRTRLGREGRAEVLARFMPSDYLGARLGVARQVLGQG